MIQGRDAPVLECCEDELGSLALDRTPDARPAPPLRGSARSAWAAQAQRRLVVLPAALACAAVLAAALLRLGRFLGLNLDQQVTLIPDDAFYYFVLAKNFSLLGVWTFDGQAPATGFHLLLGYLLAGVYRVWPDLTDGQLFALVASLATLLIGCSAYLVATALRRDFGAPAVLGVVLAFTANLALQQQTYMVESCLVIFFSSALLAMLSKAAELDSLHVGWLAAALALGLLGNLSRSDAGVLGACCMAALWSLGWRSVPAGRSAVLAAAATLGAAIGVLAVSLHTVYWSGALIQGSARMKHHWAALAGYDVLPFLQFLVRAILGQGNRGSAFVTETTLVAVAGLFCALAGSRGDRFRTDRWALAAGCALSLLAYVVLYGSNSAAIQPWYLANVCVPIAYLLGLLTSFIDRRWLGAAIAATAVSATHNAWVSLRPVWPHQVAMKSAGEYLRSHPEFREIGAWNAGLISHFSGRPIVNLDGLVNDDVYSYAASGRLLEYICRRELRFVVDFAAMLDDSLLSERGGYGDGRLRGLLSPQVQLSNADPNRRWESSDMQIYRLNEDGCP